MDETLALQGRGVHWITIILKFFILQLFPIWTVKEGEWQFCHPVHIIAALDEIKGESE